MNHIFAPAFWFGMLAIMNEQRDTAGRWREVLRRQVASGLSVAAFCRRSKVSQASFYAWRRKLRDTEPFAPGRNLRGFAEVRLAPEPEAATGFGALELHLPHGRRVIVRPGFDRRTLLDLVSTLEQRDANVASPEAGA